MIFFKLSYRINTTAQKECENMLHSHHLPFIQPKKITTKLGKAKELRGLAPEVSLKSE